MKLKVEKLGRIEKGEIKTNKLMVLCGPNNYGKTQLTYTLYGIYDSNLKFYFNTEDKKRLKINKKIELSIEEIKSRIQKALPLQIKNFLENLGIFFSFDSEFFKNTKLSAEYLENDFDLDLEFQDEKALSLKFFQGRIEIKFEKNFIKIEILNSDEENDIIFDFLEKQISEIIQKKSFILPSVREGLNMFKTELNINRNVLIDTLVAQSQKKGTKTSNFPMSILFDYVSRYAEPISKYIEFINDLDMVTSRKKVGPFNDLANELGKIVGGAYVVENGQIYFKPKEDKKLKLPLHMVSSTVRSLAGLYLFLRYEKKLSRVIIDEPELNLHPDNQRKMARFLAKIVNKGIQVIITTHSSYIVQELNNLIQFKNDFAGKEKLKKKYKYCDEEFLDYENVSCYLIEKGTIEEMEVDRTGIYMKSFNDVINSMNNLAIDLNFEIDKED